MKKSKLREIIREEIWRLDERDVTQAIYNLLRGVDIEKASAIKYAELINKDTRTFHGKKLSNRIYSRLNDIIDDDKKVKKVLNMIKDEL